VYIRFRTGWTSQLTLGGGASASADQGGKKELPNEHPHALGGDSLKDEGLKGVSAEELKGTRKACGGNSLKRGWEDTWSGLKNSIKLMKGVNKRSRKKTFGNARNLRGGD